jgi:hypothetical protein
MNYRVKWMGLMILLALVAAQAAAQVLTTVELKKVVPASFFFSGQNASVQMRNSAGLKNGAGKIMIAGLVDTTGYATSIVEKYQGFLITEARISIGGSSLEPGAYGFGISKEDKFNVMNLAGTEALSVPMTADEKRAHPVPLKLEKDGSAYRLYAGKKYVVVKAD